MSWLRSSVNYYWYGITMDLGKTVEEPIDLANDLTFPQRDKITNFVRDKLIPGIDFEKIANDILERLYEEQKENKSDYIKLRIWLYRNLINALQRKKLEMKNDERVVKGFGDQYERVISALEMISISPNHIMTSKVALWALIENDVALEKKYNGIMGFLAVF